MKIEIRSTFTTFEDLATWLQTKKIPYTSASIRHEDGLLTIEIPLAIMSILREKGTFVSITEE